MCHYDARNPTRHSSRYTSQELSTGRQVLDKWLFLIGLDGFLAGSVGGLKCGSTVPQRACSTPC